MVTTTVSGKYEVWSNTTRFCGHLRGRICRMMREFLERYELEDHLSSDVLVRLCTVRDHIVHKGSDGIVLYQYGSTVAIIFETPLVG